MPFYSSLKDLELRDKENLLWGICQDINKLADLTKSADETALYARRIEDHCMRRLDDKIAEEKLLADALAGQEEQVRLNEMNRV